uniref:Pex19 protein n=1 Tax=Octactis speculum TaxID=3111310 RepID=A0A7S2BNY5_9STRA|mmetsp:Transcript_25444/g.34975  ORF Transcript_25444/g.34975 Transcript_25444/m.34975 type:complete len:213 (+) Transcript_25444:335-973(+)
MTWQMQPKKTSFNPGDGATDVDRSVAQTLEMLAENAKDMEGMSSTQVEGFGEDMMNNMMAEFEKLGEKEDFNQVVDGMMRQLLSKELMYEPIKQVCEKYPEWLAVQVDSLDKEEYERYGNQYQFFQRIRAVYETEPDNLARLMELMHDVQQYGQPPAEIIKELAPGLEFNAEGMPVMPGLGETMMPGQEGMPGMPGLPFPETGPDGKPCTVM